MDKLQYVFFNTKFHMVAFVRHEVEHCKLFFELSPKSEERIKKAIDEEEARGRVVVDNYDWGRVAWRKKCIHESAI